MRLLKFLLYLALGIAAILCILGIFAKKDFHIERAALIKAPKPVVFDQVRYFSNFQVWSPWTGLDPRMRVSVEGADGQPGAVYRWDGNKEAGAGSITIRSIDSSLIKTDVQILRPFGTTANSFYSINEADGGGTKVVWGFDMKMPFPFNALAMFTDLNKAFGPDYERGLDNLQKRCEDFFTPKKYNGYEVVDSMVAPRWYAATERQLVAGADIPLFLAKNYGAIGQALKTANLQMGGAPSGFYWPTDDEATSGKFDMAAAVPFTYINKEKKLPALGPGIEVEEFGGRAVVADYYGNYEMTSEAHAGLKEYMTGHSLELIPPAIEEYVTDPVAEKDTAKWLTRVIYFVKPAPEEKKED